VSKKHKGILIFVFFLFSSILYSQIDQEKKPLSEVLTLLEEKYKYQFTYADDLIKDIYIEPLSPGLAFEEVINYLRKRTGLVFLFLENNFVAINAKDSSFVICGYVIDKEMGEPIAGAIIIGKNSHATTDTFGYFKLKINQDNESIVIRHLSFQAISKSGNSFEKDFCSNIFLTPKIETLPEVVLTNFITKGINKAADGSYTMNFSNFGILPGLIETDVLQTVQALPGVQSINETVSNINIRGGTHDQNLILWDGIKMYQSGHFFGLISIFNPLITTDVSLIKNGTSVDLSDGVSGTIAMKTDTNINNSFTGSIGANFINVDAFVDAPIGKKSSLQLSARKAISDLVERNPTYDNYFDRILQDTEVLDNEPIVKNLNKKFDFYDTSLRWLYDITEKDQLRINFLFVNNEFVFNESATISQIDESKESSLLQQTYVEGLFYKRNWNDAFTTTLQVYETDYTLEAKNVDLLQQQRLEQENNVSETSIKLNTWYKYNNELSFLNGYQYTDTGVTNRTEIDDPVIVDTTRDVIREHGLYSQVNYTSNSKRTNIRAGIRYNLITIFEPNKKDIIEHLFEPRLSLSQKISDHFSIEVLGEFKHQNSSQIVNIQRNIEDEFLGIEKRRWILSNNSDSPVIIPVIQSKQASVGFNYSNKGWLISAEGYYKQVEGITSQGQGFLNQHIFERTNGSYRVYGIDFLTNKKFRQLSTWLSYSYGNNEYTFNDFEEINFPNNLDITHSVAFGVAFSTNNLKISAGINYHTGQPTTRPVTGNEIIDVEGELIINYEAANADRIEDYLRVDASATYTFNITDKIKAHTGISVWNAFNHANIINNYFTIDDNFQTKEINNKALRFTPNATFRVQF